MGRIIIKASRDRDLYVDWSTIVEAPAFIGNRTEMLAYLQRDPLDPSSYEPETRLRRADSTGTSAAGDYAWFGKWEDDGLIFQQRGTVPRGMLADFLDAYAANDMPTCLRMLLPFEEDGGG